MTTSSLKNRRRQDIDRTRGQFDGTLKELTHRINVPECVLDKVHDAKENVRVKAEEVTQQVQAKTEEVKQQVQAKAEEVKQQVQAKAEEVTQQAQAKTEEVKQQAQAKTEEVKRHVHEGTETLQAKAAGVVEQADRLTREVLAELPPPLAGRIEPLVAPARQRPLLTVALAVAALLVLLVLRHVLRRNK
jgi:chromosome segregation ATPase